jgi:hypothetical protein
MNSDAITPPEANTQTARKTHPSVSELWNQSISNSETFQGTFGTFSFCGGLVGEN